MSATLIVCATCGYDAAAPDGERPGERFARQLEARLAARPAPALRLERTACLMACKRHCTVALRAPGKYAYVLGDFAPDAAAADALLDYAAGYQAAERGVVPFKQWPEGVKGHFVARVPPPGDDL
ncbi:DUF1636 domain-containing protein [Thauera sp. CAU 1555]|uniref:DUF1636 domain-containing protein n=1 Tax=Thauera sedimentorum TaxID=2767595 RepID=A0ABR9BBZ8_9RHOO|nr:DUF1636 domain-containing protein [Thauera sedimentorum]MBC9072945.1 DUF1636 domain-containing protein [Thauera sedimentorum]MBD8503864.1 DUF1636 domain-containing protein [Thauera sedimentorum]